MTLPELILVAGMTLQISHTHTQEHRTGIFPANQCRKILMLSIFQFN